MSNDQDPCCRVFLPFHWPCSSLPTKCDSTHPSLCNLWAEDQHRTFALFPKRDITEPSLQSQPPTNLLYSQVLLGSDGTLIASESILGNMLCREIQTLYLIERRDLSNDLSQLSCYWPARLLAWVTFPPNSQKVLFFTEGKGSCSSVFSVFPALLKCMGDPSKSLFC